FAASSSYVFIASLVLLLFPTRRSSDLDTFYAVIWLDRDGELISVDSRPSDALALALRLDCPIYVEESVRASASLGRESTLINSRSEEHTSELQSRENLVCRLLLEKKKQ